MIDPVKGEFSGPNEFIYQHSNQTVERVPSTRSWRRR